MQRDLWLWQQQVMWGYQGRCTWQCQMDPGGLALTPWVQMHPDMPVPPVWWLPALSPQVGGLCLGAGLTPSLGLPIQQRNLEHQLVVSSSFCRAG